MPSIDDYASDAENQWCPGCPNFGILQAFKKALVELEKTPDQVCLISGIGQAAKLPHYLKCNFFNGLHGRPIPVALGVQTANPDLTTVVVTGDGDCYGEGGNHFIHALRRNPDITVVVHNNEIYALTKGQASPTTPQGEKRTLQVKGVDIEPLNMPAIAILHDCTFVARGFARNIDHLKGLLVEAIQHPGLSYVDVIQPCITWGTRPISWYEDRVRELGEDHNPKDKDAAMALALGDKDEFPIGILYQSEPKDPFGHQYRDAVTDGPLAQMPSLSEDQLHKMLSEFKPGAGT
ncbi:MAG: thiamine pyrophosphate-dependent enzyme [Thermodesulfobacteriota bacterium]